MLDQFLVNFLYYTFFMIIFEILFYQPIFNFLIILYRLLGENLGLSLIAIALVSRLITIPITNRQLKSAEKNKEFQEKYNEIKKKYKNNKEKLTEESAKLQSKYLPGQLGGCLPLIVQMIMFINIFNVLRNLLNTGVSAFNDVAYSFVDKFPEGASINKLFLGDLLDLGKAPSAVGIGNISEFWPYAILLVLVVLSQYYSTVIMMGSANKKKEEEKKKIENEKKKKKKDKKPDEPDFGEIMQMTSKQMMYILPLTIGFISYNSPAGLTLYWTAQSAFVIIQRLISKRVEILQFIKSKITKNGDTKPSEK